LGRSHRLDFLSPLLGLFSLLLLLGRFHSCITGGLANSLGLLSLGNDLLPADTYDGTLNLDGLAGALLGDLFGGTLLVKATEKGSPVEFTRVLLGEEVSCAFGAGEAECLAVTANEEFAVTRVDLGA
jgi:hypothetical protein